MLVFKVVNSPSTLIFWEVFEKFLVVGVLALLLDDDLCVIFVEVIDDVLVRFAKFEGLVDLETLRVDADTRCLWIRVRRGAIGLQKVTMKTCHGWI